MASKKVCAAGGFHLPQKQLFFGVLWDLRFDFLLHKTALFANMSPKP